MPVASRPRSHRNHATSPAASTLAYDQILGGIPAMVAVFSVLTGEFIYVNQAAQRILGYDQDQFLRGGLGFIASITHSKDFSELAARHQTAIDLANTRSTELDDGLIMEFEYRIKHQDGSWRWLHTDASVLSRNADGQVEIVLNASLDITERRHTEIQLHRLQRQLEQQVQDRTKAAVIAERRAINILESVSDGFIALDTDGQYLYVNHQAGTLLGLESSAIIGQSAWATDSPLNSPTLKALIKRVMTKQRPEGLDLQSPLDQRWLRAHAYSTHEGVALYLADIEDRLQSKLQLERSEARYRALIEKSTDGTALSDKNQQYTYVSPSIMRILGYTTDEFLAMHVTDLILHDDLTKHRPGIEQMRNSPGMSITTRVRARHKNGSLRWLEVTATNMLHDPSVEAVVSNFRDITARIKAQQASREAKDRLALAMEASEMGIWDWNVAANTLIWSDRLYHLFGIQPGQLQGYDHYISLVHPDDRERLQSVIQQAMTQGSMYKVEHRVIHADGSVHWLQGMGQAVKSRQGKVIRMSGTTMNIDERKELQQRKDEFLGIASHELKTPVTSLKAYTQIIERQLAKSGQASLVKHLHKMDIQLDKLTNLINDLLDVTKIESGKLILETQSFDLDQLIDEIIETMQMSTEQHQITRVGQAHHLITADRERMGQVLTNLLSNAIKYSPDASEILVHAKFEDDQVVVGVQDFGVGISQADQAQVFDRFYRAGGELGQTFPGLGLGLYICAEIIRRHSGHIWVDSQPGKGSTFSFSLGVK